MRKLLGNCFSERSLRSQHPTIEYFADLFIPRIRALAEGSNSEVDGTVIDMVDWTNFFTVDVIGDLAVGESFDCPQNSEYHPWVKDLFNFLQGMVYAAATRFYPSVEWLFKKSLPTSVMELQRKHTEFVNARINRRLDLKIERPDFLTPFMKDNTDYENMSPGEFESTFAILIVAGSEATSTTLCGIPNHLVQPKNKAVLQKLVTEIRGSLKQEQEITIEATKSLIYLEAVVNEGLRNCNPVPGGLPRIVPKGGDTYAGYFIPEKYATHSPQETPTDLI
jgi:cytochrome P450